MLRIDGFDEAIIGPATIWRGQEMVSVLVYDAEKIRDILMIALRVLRHTVF